MARALWEAPFAVLSHDKFENEDPVFTYANKVCLVLCRHAALQLQPCPCDLVQNAAYPSCRLHWTFLRRHGMSWLACTPGRVLLMKQRWVFCVGCTVTQDGACRSWFSTAEEDAWLAVQAQTDRNQILEAAAENGVIRNYSAWRQSLKGKRFQIKDTTLFNLETPTEKKVQCLRNVHALSCMNTLQNLLL